MKNRTFVQKIIPLMFAISFLNLLFAGNNVNDHYNLSESSTSESVVKADDVCRVVQGVCSEELLPSNTSKITHPETGRKRNCQQHVEQCFKENAIPLIALIVLYLIQLQIFRQIRFRRKYIIKYIHDQDGRKSTPSLLCTINQ